MRNLLYIIILLLLFSCTNQDPATKTINPEVGQKKLDSMKLAYQIRVAEAKYNDSVETAMFLKTKAGKIWKKHPDWTREECIEVSHNNIWIGMSYFHLIYMRGKPDNVNISNYGNGNQYQWCWYDYTPSYFYGGDDGIITSWN